MLKYGVLAVLAATAIAAALMLLPAGSNGPRPEPKLLNDPSAPAPSGFVIKNAPPASAPPAAPPSGATAPVQAPPTAAGAAPQPGAPPVSTTDLDVLMQKLRAASIPPDATASATVNQPAPAAASQTPPQPAAQPAPAAPPPPHWTSVTSQGTRWRMVRTPGGFTVSIDLGTGQVADVHVLPQFGNLDIAATNVRIDYLKQTILRDFSAQSGSYVFSRDGSVSLLP